jgi:hypothetical protein
VNLRNTLFPMIVIVLLVYLASQNLMGEDETKLPYSDVQRLVFSHPEQVDELTFRPNERTVVLKLSKGTTIRADYPRAATPAAFEPPMASGCSPRRGFLVVSVARQPAAPLRAALRLPARVGHEAASGPHLERGLKSLVRNRR